MRERRGPLVAAVVAALASGAIAATFVLGRAGPAQPPPGATLDPGPEGVAVRVSVSPPSHSFGDRVTARLVVAVAPSAIDPGTVTLRPSFEPYTVVEPERLERWRSEGVAYVQATYGLQCLERACLSPDGTAQTLRLTPAVVGYLRGRDGVEARIEWPQLTLRSRISEEDTTAPIARAQPGSLPALTRRLSPDLLSWLCLGLATVLVLAVAAIAAVRLRAGAPAPTADGEPAAAPDRLARALERLEPHVTVGGTEARPAAEAVALALAALGRDAEARDARRIAWSRRPPVPEELALLAASARKAQP